MLAILSINANQKIYSYFISFCQKKKKNLMDHWMYDPTKKKKNVLNYKNFNLMLKKKEKNV